MGTPTDPRAEWLETDGLGGFASGTVGGVRTRRYHALLLVSQSPPTHRVVLVNGFDAWIEIPTRRAGQAVPERVPITSQRYTPDVTHPDGAQRLAGFVREPWPRWTFRLPDGTEVVQELVVPRDAPAAALSWRLGAPRDGVTLVMRPFFTGRDTHATHHENPSFRFDADVADGGVAWRPYETLPAVVARTNGSYTHDPQWYRNVQYDEERARGLDFVEDVASPGVFRWDLSRGEAVWIVSAAVAPGAAGTGAAAPDAAEELARIRRAEQRRRRRFPTRLHRAADQYLVRRGDGETIIAGYPWFSDWGRDTFIALRGLCIAAGRLDEARRILVEWAGHVSEGMLPNLFPEGGTTPEYNAVDASLWYVVAVHDLLTAAARKPRAITERERGRLLAAVDAILTGYANGTRFGIRADADGLLAAGAPGLQLTWMDAKIGDWVVTPRAGKPVEVQALWLNALRIGSNSGAESSGRWRELFDRGAASFRQRFWREAEGCLYDVVDVDHPPGTADATFRPNQLLAVGGLPFPLLEGIDAWRLLDAVEARLWTPLGPRSLAPGERGYTARYEGGVFARDSVYHQGPVWPWLAGAFVEGWVRARGSTVQAKREARGRFLTPLLEHLEQAGLGHVSELADADAPFTPRGCPFQAWSVGELLRLDAVVLREDDGPPLATRRPAVHAAR